MKWLRLSCIVLIVSSIIFTIFVGKNKIANNHVSGDTAQYKGIITMWHVDSFEGGRGSRRQFLLKVARDFEKQNSGVLIMVTDFTIEGAEEQMKNGKYPDLISFGNGVNVTGLNELKTKNVIKSGKLGDKAYATAWCRGGYVLIENTVQNIRKNEKNNVTLISCQKYTQPLVALLYEGLDISEIELKPSMEAYVDFVNKKSKYLLGTQRDVVRLTLRGVEFTAKPITKFNDLYQYVAVTCTDQIKKYYAEKFVDYLLSEKVQSALGEICMFSAFVNAEQQIDQLNLMQKTKCESSLSAFISSEQLIELSRLGELAYKGNAEALNKIKNMVV